jgi:hypothetical protein
MFDRADDLRQIEREEGHMRRLIELRYIIVIVWALWGFSLYISEGNAAGLLINGSPENTCPTVHCLASRFHGYISDADCGAPRCVIPFTVDVWGQEGACLRIDVGDPSATVDLFMVLVSPSGVIWRNRNRSARDSRPLIKVDPVPEHEFYTLIISSATTETTSFPIRYGNWNSGNINCVNPTPPLPTRP